MLVAVGLVGGTHERVQVGRVGVLPLCLGQHLGSLVGVLVDHLGVS